MMKPLLIQSSTQFARSMEPFNWQGIGMGYAIRTSEGRFIVVDGGWGRDAERFISLLEEHADGVPEIDLWIITHPHIDHYGALRATADEDALRKRVRVNRFLYRMPAEDTYYEVYKRSFPEEVQTVHRSAAKIGAPVFTANAGDTYTVDDVTVEILHTVADMEQVDDPNETSMIFFVKVAGQTILFLGDAYSRPCRQLAAKMGDGLKCDFCQLSHHGYNGGADELYALAKPEVGLLSTSRPAYDVLMFGEHKETVWTRHNRHLMQALSPERLWISADGERVAELPFDFSQLP